MLGKLKKYWRKSLIIVLIFFMANFFCPRVLAKTIIEEKTACQYEITVNMVFAFKDDQAKAKADYLLAEWQRGMDIVWNSDFGAKTFVEKCSVDYKFNLRKMAEGKSCTDYSEDHCIAVVSEQVNQRGNLADAVLVTANSGRNSWGEWTTQATALNAAHEVGHMMGLGEEYHYEMNNGKQQWINDNLKDLGPQSIMAKTWGKVAAFQEHTSKIISQAGFNLPIAYLSQPVKQNDIEIFAAYNLSDNTKNLTKVEFSEKAGKKIYLQGPLPEELIGLLIKGETDLSVYLVDQGGKLRHLSNEQIAEKLAGLDWSEKIIWFSDAIIYTYQFGEPIQ